jgi:hypothetical protein
MYVEPSNERPEGVRVSKVCGYQGRVEGVGVESLKVHGHKRTREGVERASMRAMRVSKCKIKDRITYLR